MLMSNKEDSGFIPVKIISIVLAVVVLAAVGWLVYKDTTKNQAVRVNNSQVKSSKANGAVNKQTSSTANNTLFPANSKTITGKCIGVIGSNNTIPIAYQTTSPIPACVEVSAVQNAEIINPTNQAISVTFANYHISIAAGKTYIIKAKFGSYLAPGVHVMQFSPSGISNIWLK